MRLEAKPAKIGRGNAVLHPEHGIGKVQSISEADFGGADGTKFARLFFKREALTLFLPVKDAEKTVRSPVSRQQARQVLDHIENCKVSTSKRWKSRAAAHEQVLGRCDPFEYAEMFKGLQRLDAEGSLRHTDRAHLNQATDFLADELAHALGKSLDRIREILTEAACEPLPDKA